jgi:hypothetical protein
VRVYRDRVAFGIFSEATYAIKDIQYVEIKKAFLLNSCWLELIMIDGSKTETSTLLTTANAMACQHDVMLLANNLKVSSAAIDGVFVICTILGGSGTALVAGRNCVAVFGKSIVSLLSGAEKVEVSLNQLTELKINGLGTVTSDAGVIGGGFGPEGAAVGIGVAALLNALTATSTTNTILYLAWPGAEVFLHTSTHTPEETRLRLSHAFTVVQSAAKGEVQPRANNANADIAAQLERLVALKNDGHLTAEEFSLAKANLFARM